MTSVSAALKAARARLSAAGIESAALDARLLLGAAAGLEGAALVSRGAEPLDTAAARRFEELLARRLEREPVAHILGEREFWGLAFSASPAALVPRPETEGLIEAALMLARARGADARLSICDLGVGTGAILIALLRELPRARGLALDISADALDLARENAARHGVAERIAFVRGEFREAAGRSFDIVVANPPYIPSADIARLAPEVRDFEPRLALDGGPDGLDAYREIAPLLPGILAPGGGAALEVGAGQAQTVAGLLRAAGLQVAAARPDLAGTPRVVVALRAEAAVR